MSSKFINYIKDMSSTARATISKKGLPLDLRDEVMDLTPFTKKNAGVIVVPVVTLVKILSARVIIGAGSLGGKELEKYPSWLLEISQGFIDLLKYTPHLPPVLDLFTQLLREFKMQQQYSRKEMYDRIIGQFIIKYRLHIHEELAKEIKSFFHGVIHKCNEFLRVNGVEKYREVRMLVNVSIEYIFPILEQLYTLNQNEDCHEIIQHIYLDDEMKNFENNPRIYDEIDTFDFENLLLDKAEQLREMQGQGGKRKKKMRSSTRNSYKKRKRAYKKRSCKNKKM